MAAFYDTFIQRSGGYSWTLINDDRVNAFVVDDSLFEHTSCRKTELGSRVFDHVSMNYRKGCHLMTLGRTDGNKFPQVNSSLSS